MLTQTADTSSSLNKNDGVDERWNVHCFAKHNLDAAGQILAAGCLVLEI